MNSATVAASAKTSAPWKASRLSKSSQRNGCNPLARQTPRVCARSIQRMYNSLTRFGDQFHNHFQVIALLFAKFDRLISGRRLYERQSFTINLRVPL